MLCLLIIPTMGRTHTGWIKATPDENEILTEVPRKVVFELIGYLDTALSKIEVFDSKRNRVSKETKFEKLEERTVIYVELSYTLKAGSYTVEYTFVNLDKHIQQGQTGSYKFIVK